MGQPLIRCRRKPSPNLCRKSCSGKPHTYRRTWYQSSLLPESNVSTPQPLNYPVIQLSLAYKHWHYVSYSEQNLTKLILTLLQKHHLKKYLFVSICYTGIISRASHIVNSVFFFLFKQVLIYDHTTLNALDPSWNKIALSCIDWLWAHSIAKVYLELLLPQPAPLDRQKWYTSYLNVNQHWTLNIFYPHRSALFKKCTHY